MNIESQVCSLELSKRLKELGVKQESLFVWISIIKTKFDFIKLRESYEPDSESVGAYNYSAFTAAELGNLLPERIDKYRNEYIKFQKIKCEAIERFHYLCSLVECGGYHMDYVKYDCSDENEADARAKMLIYLLENKLMELPNE